MHTKYALNAGISRKTVKQIHSFLFEIGESNHRLFWINNRAFIETDRSSVCALLSQRFPTAVATEVNQRPHDFPWEC